MPVRSAAAMISSPLRADTSLPLVQQTARNIEQVKSDVSLGPVVDQQWTKIRTELDQISQTFKLPSN